jgi:hypothetical protein
LHLHSDREPDVEASPEPKQTSFLDGIVHRNVAFPELSGCSKLDLEAPPVSTMAELASQQKDKQTSQDIWKFAHTSCVAQALPG